MGEVGNIDSRAKPIGSAIKSISLKKTKTPPIIDGNLDDPAWEDGDTIKDFKRYIIKEGETPSENTEVKIIYDENNIYFGIRCYDKDPDNIRANISRRDNIDDDDSVTIYLDTFNAKNRGYYFSANPYGIQADGYHNDGEDDPTRDFVYKSQGKIDDKGWTLEVAIPFSALRFKSSDLQNWGFLITRYIARKDESISWPAISRKIMGILPQAGSVRLSGLKKGLGIDFTPYGSGGYGWAEENGESKGEKVLRFGWDLRWVPTRDFSLNLTFNPDFAQIESDANQISLNRRTELYYPEKRPFFLEGNEIYSAPIDLLYTRRIKNPEAGLKLSGQFGPMGVGVFSVYDREKDGSPSAVYNLARFKFDIFPQSYIGATITDKEYVGGNNSGFNNRMVSFDASLTFLKHYRVRAQAALSWTKNEDHYHEVPAYFFDFMRDDGNFSLNLRYEDYAPYFSNESGYNKTINDHYKKNGARNAGLTSLYMFRPENSWIKNWLIGALGNIYYDHKDTLQESNIIGALVFNFEKNVTFDAIGSYSTEAFRGKSYSKYSFMSEIGTKTSKYFNASFALNYFGPAIKYDFGYMSDPNETDTSFLGWKISYGGRAQIKPLNRLNFELTFDNERFYDKLGGSLVYSAWVTGLKTNLQITREAFFKSFIQYNSQNEQVDINALLGYMIHPGTALYLGYNNTIADVAGNPHSIDQSIFAKISYMFSL